MVESSVLSGGLIFGTEKVQLLCCVSQIKSYNRYTYKIKVVHITTCHIQTDKPAAILASFQQRKARNGQA